MLARLALLNIVPAWFHFTAPSMMLHLRIALNADQDI